MPVDLLQSASWPGVVGCESCEYVCSHGTSPGRAVMTTFPQLAKPASFGDLAFSDGRKTVVIRNCKLDRATPRWTPDGVSYTLEILDERWTWPGLGGISGQYNLKDENRKLVPWTIRSPQELAKICIDALGIKSGTINLPQGLSSASGKDLDRYLRAGENFPQSLTNPETIWEKTPPAEALAQLAETYGCRLIYQPNAVRILVGPLGGGVPLPQGPYETIAATVDAPRAPAQVGCFGAPIKFQLRFALEAVGQEWDRIRVPVRSLSYSPATPPAKPQISTVRHFGIFVYPLTVILSFTDPKTGAKIDAQATLNTTGGSVADRMNAVKAQLETYDEVANNFTITFDGVTRLQFAGNSAFPFALQAHNPDVGSDNQSFTTESVQRCENPLEQSWGTSHPPEFGNVQATSRLAFIEAQGLARASVFREYRIVNRDPYDKSPLSMPGRPLTVPWYSQKFGPLKRRQQIILLETKVEQVIPLPRIPGAVNANNRRANEQPDLPGQGVLPEFYNGYSRSQANTVRGSVWRGIGNVNWLFALNAKTTGTKFNTDEDDRVFVDFSVNQVEQLIVFNEAVYRYVAGAGAMSVVEEPRLVLECGCNILHPDTNQPLRWEEVMNVPGGLAPPKWSHREDVSVGVIGKYGPHDKLVGFDYFGREDAKARAAYYNRGAAAVYQVVGGETRAYIGIIPHDPDGYTQQVSWRVGEGATTTIGANTEFHPAVPPYWERRLQENLSPNGAAWAVNLRERALADEAKPKEVK